MRRCSLPRKQAFVQKLRAASHWHAGETRWAVFIDVAGKAGQVAGPPGFVCVEEAHA